MGIMIGDSPDYNRTTSGVVPLTPFTVDPSAEESSGFYEYRVNVRFGDQVTKVNFRVVVGAYGVLSVPANRVLPNTVKISR